MPCITNNFRKTHEYEGKRLISSILFQFGTTRFHVLHWTAILMLHQRFVFILAYNKYYFFLLHAFYILHSKIDVSTW